MTEPELIEAMARAACAAYGINEDAPSLGRDMKTRPALRNREIEMRAALEAIKANGCKVIEREPTPMMTAEGWPNTSIPDDLRVITKWYQAMFDAAPAWPGEGR